MLYSRPNKAAVLLPSAMTVLALILSGMLAAVLAAKGENPHDFQNIGCTHCHISVPGQSAIINKKVFRRDISELCLECHKDSKENEINHRLGVIPSMKVPDDLHLGPRGELTCITCHMPHLPHSDRKSGGRTYFLRRSILKRELCLACHYEEKFAEPTSSFRVLAPIDNSIIKTLPIPFIAVASDELVREANLFVNGTPIHLNVKNKYFSTLLHLQEGVNTIKIEAPRAKKLVMNLLYNPSLPDDMTYKLYYSHGILKKSDCKFCHSNEPNMAIVTPDRALCGKCHEVKIKYKFLHGPVAASSCIVCHDPHGQTNRYFLVEEGEKLCFKCHTEKEILLHFLDKSSANMDLLKMKGCVFCHDPHQSERKYLLRKRKT